MFKYDFSVTLGCFFTTYKSVASLVHLIKDKNKNNMKENLIVFLCTLASLPWCVFYFLQVLEELHYNKFEKLEKKHLSVQGFVKHVQGGTGSQQVSD